MLLQTPQSDVQRLRETDMSDCIAMMEETPRSANSIRSHFKTIDGVAADGGQAIKRLRLRVTVRQSRILLFTTNIVLCVAVLVTFFGYGYDWSRFDSRALSDSEKNALLDRYNSFSGSAASAVTRPIEIFISMAVHIVVLRLIAVLVFDGSTSGWRIQSATAILTALLGCLIGKKRFQCFERAATATGRSSSAVSRRPRAGLLCEHVSLEQHHHYFVVDDIGGDTAELDHQHCFTQPRTTKSAYKTNVV